MGRRDHQPSAPDDDSLAELSPMQRVTLADVWLGRAASERRVSDSFVVVRDALASLGAAEDLVDLATRAIDDEMRHAELSREVASRYARAPLDTLREVEPWLPAMAVANLRMWRETNRTYGSDAKLAAHGAPRLESVENSLMLAFRDLILPGFEHLGLATAAMQTWLASGAPT
jgi:hypothetical protein